MNIIIAGGSGLIGSALTRALTAKNHRVTLISRQPESIPSLPEGVNAISWEQNQLESALGRADAVVNLAGASLAGDKPWQMRWTRQRKANIIASRLKAGELLTQAISRAGRKPEVLIQASAIGYYGNGGREPADETAGPGTDFLARVSLAWEPSTAGVEALGLRRVIIRIGMVLSRDSGLLFLLKLPFTFFVGGRIGSGQQYLSWIHIDDVVEAIRFLAENTSSRGIYNLTSPNPVTNSQFAGQIGRQLARPSWFALPAPALKLALGEAATLALDGRPVFPTRLLDAGYQFKYDTLEPALLDLLG